jgi:Uncharacterized protein conserved in bacteria
MEHVPMKKFLVIFAWIVGGIFVLGTIGGLVGSIGMGEIKRLSFDNIDLSKINDGTYIGSYHKGRWTYDVKVAVKDHRIIQVQNTNERMRMMKGFDDKVAAAIIARQSANIDVVSGATVNTRAFQKAVENALKKAAEK